VTRRIRRSTVVPLFTLAIAAAGVSMAHAACPPQDAVCLGEGTAGTGQGVVDDAIGPIDTPGDGTIAPVTDTTDPALGDVRDRLDEILGGAGVDPPDPIGGGGSSGGGTHHPPGKGSRGTSSHAPGHGGAARGRIPGGSRLNGVAGTGHAPSTLPGAVVRDPDLASRGRFDAALEGVARSLAIVLALFGLAVGFVTIQDRLDRKDPRLALAPVESDIVEFA
jgi:hypothetical protein